MNYGRFTSTKYIKHVCIGKAVLWKDKQLSLRVGIVDKINSMGLKKIVFVDRLRGEKWVFDTKKVLETMELKRVGQESQYYFPIELAKKIKIEKIKKTPMVLDKTRNVYVDKRLVFESVSGEQLIQTTLF